MVRLGRIKNIRTRILTQARGYHDFCFETGRATARGARFKIPSSFMLISRLFVVYTDRPQEIFTNFIKFLEWKSTP